MRAREPQEGKLTIRLFISFRLSQTARATMSASHVSM